MDDFDDELRRRLSGTAGELERSGLARTAPGAFDRTVRRHRRVVAAQAATATFAVVAVATFGARLLTAPAGDPPLVAAPGTTSPSPSEPPAPSPAPEATMSPSATLPPEPAGSVTATPRTSPPSPQPAATSARPAAPPVACQWDAATTSAPRDVSVSIELSDRTVARGGSLRMTVVVRNDGSTPVEYTTSGRQYDFWVEDATATRWVWSADKAFTQELRYATLQPGQEIRQSVTWNLTGCPGPGGAAPAALPAGRYAAVGYWVSDAERGRGWTSAPVQFEID